MPKHKFREAWLSECVDKFCRPHFKKAGYTIPDNVRAGVGWPSTKALSTKRRIGEAWSYECSSDKAHEIIISLCLDDPVKVAGVLVHELVHVTVGCQHGHKKPFIDCMKAVGLTGKPTATGESDALVADIRKWLGKLGPYPHAKLDKSAGPKKQSTRLIKLQCPDCECIIRTTDKWLCVHNGEWPCPCGGEFTQGD